MATLTIRVDDTVRDRLQSLADGRGHNVSDLLRGAINGLLDDGGWEAPRAPAVPESISAVDRRQLALLHRILARLVGDGTAGDRTSGDGIDEADERLEHDGDMKYQLDRAEVLESGWSSEYNVEFSAFESELSRRDCGTVMDVLDMFRVIRSSLADVPELAGKSTALLFPGFDGNDERESRYLDFARWLIRDGKWTDLADVFNEDNDGGNSHRPLLPVYERMLAVFQPLWADVVRRGGRHGFLLNGEELLLIADAVTHPENRSPRGLG